MNALRMRDARVILGTNDLASQRPDLAEEWHPFKNQPYSPEKITVHSNFEAWWHCSICGEEWQSRVSSRSNGSGCPQCVKKKARDHRFMTTVKQGINDLASQFPDIAAEWNYEQNEYEPHQVSAFSGLKVWWTCKKCGYKWQAIIYNRTKKKSQCPLCSKKHTHSK